MTDYKNIVAAIRALADYLRINGDILMPQHAMVIGFLDGTIPGSAPPPSPSTGSDTTP